MLINIHYTAVNFKKKSIENIGQIKKDVMTLKSLVWDLVDRIKHIRKQTTSPVLTNQPTKWIIDTFFQQSRGDHKTSTCSGSFLCENDVISIPKFSIPDKKLYFKNMILNEYWEV